jgi:chromosomal replication initiator protein
MSFVPTSSTVIDPWTRILGALEKKVSRHTFNTFLKPTRMSHLNGRILFVRIPSTDFQHVGERYADLIGEAIERLELDIDDVQFVTLENDPSVPQRPREVREDGGFPPAPAHAPNTLRPANQRSAPGTNGAPGGQQTRFDWNTASQLNPRYNFDGFVSGAGNQFARAAAEAVAERPSKAYNPLFLYGGVGLGKTHLMHAIGHEVKRRQPQSAICYVSSEKFTNEMISYVRNEKMSSFRDKYRGVDVLLIDDIQFLASKERTQDEFFHTFNALHEADKQIVIASDRPPKDLAGLEERLRSRFEWGLIADIQPPDLETKVAILQKRAENEQCALPMDVALYMATNIRTNIRELEGAFTRLLAWSSLNGVEITLSTAQQALKQFIDTQVRKITIEAIQRIVSEHFGMKVTELKQKNNSRSVVVPRQIAMYLAKQMTEASLPEIGRQFGGKHHTTVMHSIGKIDEEKRTDKDLNRTLNKIMETLNS